MHKVRLACIFAHRLAVPIGLLGRHLSHSLPKTINERLRNLTWNLLHCNRHCKAWEANTTSSWKQAEPKQSSYNGCTPKHFTIKLVSRSHLCPCTFATLSKHSDGIPSTPPPSQLPHPCEMTWTWSSGHKQLHWPTCKSTDGHCLSINKFVQAPKTSVEKREEF